MSAESVALPSGLASGGIAYPLPGGEVTRVEALAFKLVTDGNAANRQVHAGLRDASGAFVFVAAAAPVQTAGETVVYSFAPEVPPFGTAALGFAGGPFPRVAYADNLEVVVVVANAQVGDAISEARLLVVQYERADPYTVEAERMAGA